MRKAIGCAALSCALGLAHAKALKWSEDGHPRWVPPQETPVGYMLELGMSPPMPTPAPKASRVRAVLEARDTDDNTCGYVSGIPTSSLWCANTARCVYNSIHSHIGCCDDTTSNCPIWTTCFDSSERDSYTTNNGRTLWCGNDEYPYCHTHLYQDEALVGYTLLGCAVAAGTGQVWYSSSRETPTPSPSRSPTPITDPSTFSDDPTRTPDPISSTTSTATPPPVESSSTPVGAIVGGVVGGIGALALIVLGVWWLMRMHDKQKKEAAAAAAAAGMAPHHQQQQPPPNGGDPHMSQLPPQHHQQQPPQGYYVASYAKPPAGHGSVAYSTTTAGGYDQATVVGSSPPGSPPLSGPGSGYQNVQGTPSPPPQGQGQFGGFAGFGAPQQGQQQQQQFGNVPPGSAVSPGTQVAPGGGFQPQQQQQQQQPPPGYGVGDGYGGGQQQGYAAELPAQRGDGELRELHG
ncbi:uncharacterized protein B0H64DRAFT_95835 [Chaetomium fimeti]|uniref:Uncharacterized protein n=1 Tax=Chaetomium fimeti TaxID=1854472 RepID=A0AAE0LVP2_9PEZI|nr:hypothetical protein B0H64DRAFT_95835 [Chaetomium fimeti]